MVAIVIGATVPAAAASVADPADVFRQAASGVAPCVVTIETVGGTQPTAPDRPRPRAGTAAPFIVPDGPTTGLIWSSDGLIITSSFNFVRRPSVITVVLADGRRFVAKEAEDLPESRLLATDEIRRLAMLKIDTTGLPTPRWADDGEIRPGQYAISLGRGHGPAATAAMETGGCTLTIGIVSGVNRMSGLAVQTDAKLSPASFGGPLVDLHGRVIGLCVPMGLDSGELSGVEWYDSGIGFAVPRSQIERVSGDLADGHNIRRGLLGIDLHRMVRDAVIISGIRDPSPALRAGLQVGDRIVAIDEEPVGIFADLKRVLRPRPAGTRVQVHLKRDGRDLTFPLVLAVTDDIGPIPPPESPPAATQDDDDDEDDERPAPRPSSRPS
ncbi:MAG: trypsin-like peptidase domain-containing protein [Planctomycetes bacterium]|nr:trypsin-like peptidase domain-containing protein [Planctomycetota bacterium]